MLDVLPEDPVLGVVLKRDEAALLGATHLRGESGRNRRASAPIPSASLVSGAGGSRVWGVTPRARTSTQEAPVTEDTLWPRPARL